MLEDVLLRVQDEKDNYKIGPSSIHGNGVMATKFIKKNELIKPAFLPDMKITEFGAHLNYSENPNAITKRIGKYYLTYSLQDIHPEEEITIDYRVNKNLEQPKLFWETPNNG